MNTQIIFAQSALRTGYLVASGGKLSPVVSSVVLAISTIRHPSLNRYSPSFNSESALDKLQVFEKGGVEAGKVISGNRFCR